VDELPDLITAYDVAVAPLGEDARRHIFRDTAVRVYRLATTDTTS
jgi:predicted TIM-barrel fold metal-dependent hydrolase